MDGSRVQDVVREAMERWGKRLSWIVMDREDDDFLFYIGVDGATGADEDMAVQLTVDLVPEAHSAAFSHAVFVQDAKRFSELSARLKSQVVYNRDALGVAEQAATMSIH